MKRLISLIALLLVLPAVAYAGAEKTEGAKHVDSDVGVAILGIANEAGNTLETDGNYTGVSVDTKGRLITSTTTGGGSAIVVEDAATVGGANLMAVGTTSKADPEGTVGAAGDNQQLLTDSQTGSLFVSNEGTTKTVEAALTVSAGAYAAGDYIYDSSGDANADGALDFSSAFRNYISTGEIRSVIITDEGGEAANLEVWFFDTDPTTTETAGGFTDNSAIVIDDADLVNVCCVVPVTSHYASSASGVSIGSPNNCHCGNATEVLHAAVVAREAVTFDATDALTIRVVIDQD